MATNVCSWSIAAEIASVSAEGAAAAAAAAHSQAPSRPHSDRRQARWERTTTAPWTAQVGLLGPWTRFIGPRHPTHTLQLDQYRLRLVVMPFCEIICIALAILHKVGLITLKTHLLKHVRVKYSIWWIINVSNAVHRLLLYLQFETEETENVLSFISTKWPLIMDYKPDFTDQRPFYFFINTLFRIPQHRSLLISHLF